MGLPVPKQFIRLRGIPLLIRTISCFLATGIIRPVVVALPGRHTETANHLLTIFLSREQRQNIIMVTGGQTRQDSVMAGLQALPRETDIVLVHDGARPFVTSDIIHRCIQTALDSGAAITAVPVRDTIKQVDQTKRVTGTVDRENLWQAQTPQGARYDLLLKAYAFAGQSGFQGTDEASLLEHAGYPVAIVEGSSTNIKITRQDDLKIAEGILEEEKQMKVGHGFDAHRFMHSRKLILGGVSIPFDLGLEGHSDADVLTHALIDSLLGAMGAGDIGYHFPDNDPAYKNISSMELLEKVIEKMQEAGYGINNADMTVICQRPKLAPYIDEMRDNIAKTCQIPPASVNIKATTTEMMGFTGRGEGIAAQSVVLLQTSPDENIHNGAVGNAD